MVAALVLPPFVFAKRVFSYTLFLKSRRCHIILLLMTVAAACVLSKQKPGVLNRARRSPRGAERGTKTGGEPASAARDGRCRLAKLNARP